MQDIVIQSHKLAAGPGIALASTAPEQLAIDACGFMEFRADHVQAAQFGNAGSQLDVRASAGHVRGHGHLFALTGRRDDVRFFSVPVRVSPVSE